MSGWVVFAGIVWCCTMIGAASVLVTSYWYEVIRRRELRSIVDRIDDCLEMQCYDASEIRRWQSRLYLLSQLEPHRFHRALAFFDDAETLYRYQDVRDASTQESALYNRDSPVTVAERYEPDPAEEDAGLPASHYGTCGPQCNICVALRGQDSLIGYEEEGCED